MPLPQDTLILIVEDSLTQAVQLQFLLEKNGFKVTCAHNGRQATGESPPRETVRHYQ